MKKYRTKEIIEAQRWFNVENTKEIKIETYNGENKYQICVICNEELKKHGKILSVDDFYDLICPGDWLIKYKNGKIYSCEHETFIKLYEEVDINE